MSQQQPPPKELFLLIWDSPWLVLVTHDVSDWGHKTEPPKYWIRYEFSDFGTVSVESDGEAEDGEGDGDSLDSEEGPEDDGGI